MSIQPLIAQGRLPRLKGDGYKLPKVTKRVAEPDLLPPIPVLIGTLMLRPGSLGSMLLAAPEWEEHQPISQEIWVQVLAPPVTLGKSQKQIPYA